VKETCKQIVRTNKYKEIDRRSTMKTMPNIKLRKKTQCERQCTATLQKPNHKTIRPKLKKCKKNPKKLWENHRSDEKTKLEQYKRQI